MAIQGLRDTGNFVTGQRPENWREGILMLYPNSAEAAKAPLTALTSRMKEAETTDPIFHWWEKSMQTRRVALTTAILASAAGSVETIFATGGGFSAFKNGDLFMVEQSIVAGGTMEIMRVTGDPASNTQAVVTRGVGGTTPAAMNPATSGHNPNILCIGSSYEEGSLAPSGISFDPTDVSNYTQIFRQTTEMTRSAMRTKLRTPDARNEAKREALELIGVDMERAFMFGKKGTGTQNGKPIRYTGGIYNTLASGNRKATTGAALKMTELEDWMLLWFAVGSSQKVALGGNRALMAIQQAVRKNTNYQIFANEKEYGMRVTRIISPFGELVFFAHPLMTQTAGGTNTTAYYAQDAAMWVLDMANFRYRYLTGSDLSFEDELEVPGMDGLKEGYIAECGLEINHASTHWYHYNMNAGAADT